MEPVAYLGGALGYAPFYIGQILENLVSLSFARARAQRKCAPFWKPKYAIAFAWSSAPDPAGKLVLHRFRSSYLGIELERRTQMRYCGIDRKGEPVLMDHQCLCTKLL